jgi:hypothetical protein
MFYLCAEGKEGTDMDMHREYDFLLTKNLKKNLAPSLLSSYFVLILQMSN